MKKVFKIVGIIFMILLLWLILGMFFDSVFKFGLDIFMTIAGFIMTISDFLLESK
jgi:hypothetical protein